MEREPLTCGWSHAIIILLIVSVGTLTSISSHIKQGYSPTPAVIMEQVK